MNNTIELLSPAGNFDALRAAVQNGADAVYLGGKGFGARQFAGNFDDVELEKAVDYCHAREVLVYLTVNTLVLNREMAEFEKFIRFARVIGIDAFIVQDMGVASTILDIAPDVPIHGSTQTTVNNLEGAKRLKMLGFSRLVLPREMSAEQVGYISQNSNIETEVFVHGAICVCYSGQCLLSSIIGCRSGNRGRCAQPCRLPYTLLKDGKMVKEGYILNPKDLCLVEMLDTIKKSGVKSLKIEGRMKGAEYVATVTSVYRRYIDGEFDVKQEDIDLMAEAFSRGGFTKGFFGGDSEREFIRLESSNDDVYKGKNDAKYAQTYTENANIKRLSADAFFVANADEKPVLTVKHGGFIVTVEGDLPVQRAVKHEMSNEQIVAQLEKTDKSPFYFNNIEVEIENGLFMPVKEINAIRRQALERFETRLVNSYKREENSLKTHELKKPVRVFKPVLSAQVENAMQAKILLDKGISRIYVPIDFVLQIGYKSEIVPLMPDIVTDDIFETFRISLVKIKEMGYNVISVGNLGVASMAIDMGFEVWGGSALNVFNTRAVEIYSKMGFVGMEASRELNLRQMSDIAKSVPIPLEAMIYGRLKVMSTKHCVIKTATGTCDCSNGNFSLKDRKGEEFVVIGNKIACTNTILNSKPIYMADKLGELKTSGISMLKLVFTVENPTECDRIYMLYKNSFEGYALEMPKIEYTRGHFYRGVD